MTYDKFYRCKVSHTFVLFDLQIDSSNSTDIPHDIIFLDYVFTKKNLKVSDGLI